jgi:exonuclease III
MIKNNTTIENLLLYSTNLTCTSINLKPKKLNNTSQNSLNNNKLNYKLNHLKIGSLNVRGLNDNTKLKCLISYIKEEKFDIFGLSETKLQNFKNPPNKLDNFIIHWSNHPNKNQAGTAIIINSTIYKHLYKTTTLNGFSTSIFLHFKPKIKICITQIYLPFNPQEKNNSISHIKTLINENKQKNIEHIIMGDFNSIPKKIDRLHPNNTPPFKIYSYLTNYLDTFRLLHPNKI